MDNGSSCNRKNKFMKLSLKKNRIKHDDNHNISNCKSDIIVLDDSFDTIRPNFPKTLLTKNIINSPILINDSSEVSTNELPSIVIPGKEPSQCGNVSFNCSRDSTSPSQERNPSMGGWSPAQNIITASPKYELLPSTPKDIANESYEHCSLQKIQESQKKILTDLYGDIWKSIPKIFKNTPNSHNKFGGVTKKLFDDEESEKENIRHTLQKNKQLYLTDSNAKRNDMNFGDTEKKSKKKLFTEHIPSTPDVTRPKTKFPNVNSTTKKVKIKKGMSVTELVQVMNTDSGKENSKDVKNLSNKVNDIDISTKKEKDTGKKVKKTEKVDILTKKIENVYVTPRPEVNRLSFIGSLADNVPSWRCHPEALQYRDDYKNLREKLTARLFTQFNKDVFNGGLEADMLITWDGKLRSTAGTTRNRLIKTAGGGVIRTSSIKLSTKVLDDPQRLRDTLIHELCHSATWVIDTELRAGHGPLWKKWASRALQVFPELKEISRCHDLEIHFKYTYRCTKCGYRIHRHSKSIDITKKLCGYCRGTFEIELNKKNKDGVLTTTPARKGATNGFALYVKENYASVKSDGKTHAQVMKLLGEQFSAQKNKNKV